MPTRERVEWVERYFQSVIEHTSNLGNIELVLYIDDDDSASRGLDCEQFRVVKIIGPRLTMGALNTACMKKASGEIIILQNDDVVIRTKGWDEIVINFHNRSEDGIYLAYPNDLDVREELALFPILSRRTCELLIEPFPNLYVGGFIDYHIFDIFIRLQKLGFDRISFMENLVMEHLHYSIGKSALDMTYKGRGYFSKGDEAFVGLRTMRQEGAQCLASAIQGKPLPITSVTPLIPEPFSGIGAALIGYGKTFLLDAGLPLKWRLEMFLLFVSRYLGKQYKVVKEDRILPWRLTALEYLKYFLSSVRNQFK